MLWVRAILSGCVDNESESPLFCFDRSNTGRASERFCLSECHPIENSFVMSQRLGTVALELRVSDRGMPDAQQAGSVGFDNAANLFITFDSALHVRLLPEPQPV